MQEQHTLNLSSGPCSKHSSWRPPSCILAGRSHRSSDAMATIREVIALQREILSIPDDYLVGIVSGSATGAMETLMWSLLGARGVNVISHCVFSKGWENDILNELGLEDVNVFREEFPKMANTQDVNFDKDTVFCWTSTPSGVSFADANWIKADRKGLTICDAVSAVFSINIDWSKLDATAFSWQKGIGGEAGLGTIVLSPRAVERLESHKPSWPIPKIFRIATNKKVNYKLFDGYVINTPSMICLEDYRNILTWAKNIGGMPTMLKRVESNYAVINEWISKSSIFNFLVEEKYRARHIACIDIKTDEYQNLSEADKWSFLKKIIKFCEQERFAFDFLGHAMTKPHLRVWAGPTIESNELEIFLPKIELAYTKIVA